MIKSLKTTALTVVGTVAVLLGMAACAVLFTLAAVIYAVTQILHWGFCIANEFSEKRKS